MFRTQLIPTFRQLAVIALCGSLPALDPAAAADAFYVGSFKIVSASIAPWVAPGTAVDDSEMHALIGKTITLAPASVDGPGGFPCASPQYEVLEGAADILFQGAFGEMSAKDPKIDPRKLADQVGLPGTTYRTVVTGCEYEVDLSFPAGDDDHAAFGLNDFVYLLQRQ
jgi:hypothetical protein